MSEKTDMVLDSTVRIADEEYSRDENGFLKQNYPKPFTYSLDYKAHQSTNTAMTWLRLGWLSGYLSYGRLRHMTAVDIGAGNGSFVRESASVFKSIVPYDLAGESISDVELYETKWDMLVLSDVLEHYTDIDLLWSLNFKYAMISFPETPDPEVHDLSRWRHLKPNEHIYLLTMEKVKAWVQKHGYVIVGCGCPEDMIRRRWQHDTVNISTVLIKRCVNA